MSCHRTAALVARNKRQVAIPGVVHDLERQVGGGTADLATAHDAVANIDDGVVGIREIVQHDFAVFAEYLLQKIDHRQKATYGLVHGQLLWVKSEMFITIFSHGNTVSIDSHIRRYIA